MFGSKQRRLDRQQKRINNLVDELRKSRKLQATFQNNTKRIAQSYAEAHDGGLTLQTRLDRALRACAGYRAELTASDRVIRGQQKRLDESLGYDSATDRVLEAGVRWQERRHDKPTAPAVANS